MIFTDDVVVDVLEKLYKQQMDLEKEVKATGDLARQKLARKKALIGAIEAGYTPEVLQMALNRAGLNGVR